MSTQQQQLLPPVLNPPDNFGIVERGVYRCSFSSKGAQTFLENQIPDLKTVFMVERAGSTRSKPLILCLKDRGNVDIVTYEMKQGRPFADVEAFLEERHLRLIKKAMEIILDTSRHPVLICCKNGVYYTSLIVGCLRKIQSWSFSSIVCESKEFSSRYVLDVFSKHFIERLDLSQLKLPIRKLLPTWVVSCELLSTDDGKKEEEEKKKDEEKSRGAQNEKPFWIEKKWSSRDALASKDLSDADIQTLLVKSDD
jgi:hypothetical protein